VVAGIGKLLDLNGSKNAMLGFGFPTPGVARVDRIADRRADRRGLAPAVRTAWWGALLSFLLLAAFVVGIAYNMKRAARPTVIVSDKFIPSPPDRERSFATVSSAQSRSSSCFFGTDRWSFSHGNAGHSLRDGW